MKGNYFQKNTLEHLGEVKVVGLGVQNTLIDFIAVGLSILQIILLKYMDYGT